MNPVLDEVLGDLQAESAYVESLLADLDEQGWRTATPAEGWDVATTIAHLLWTDEASVKAIAGTLLVNGDADKEPWDALVMDAFADPSGFVDTAALTIAKTHTGAELLERWQASKQALAAALRSVPDGQKLMWFGPPMAPASMATARLMETWAHGLDVADAVGAPHSVTDRIRHVASIGFRTRSFAFAQNGLDAPAEPIRLELVLPSGEPIVFGPDDATQTVTGSAYDFAALATQRVHRDDTDLVATGADAETWLTIAQAFAGPAGGGRAPKGERA
ncbi:TIGR03084 family metal-binding protein [Nocardioides jiangxiensis]|uniref:TIGR03084 family metal-binding protein n=1 Tax=Nocardioides jiangxiensis TaxID=3064524 RepID=A0ABT9AZN0_9ACTN|nr:TIGR03084 family metal-binding protein [Nocardioides sp. WY-20]MDO7868054.1 TIGR03084 family metal-binding protein [Nocardioides sp. WY-20]